MSTLICRVQTRLPIAVVAMYGTLDPTSAARMMITVRDVVSEAPIALIVDAEHLVVTADSPLGALVDFARQSRHWPGTVVGLACAPARLAAMIRDHDGESGDGLVLYDDLAQGRAAARDLPVPRRRSVELLPDQHAPAQARQFVQDVCAGWSIARVANLAELVASELVTNAVTHARTPMALTLRLVGDRLSVDVRDGDPRPMFRPAPGAGGGPADEHGRGLLVLDAMADAWGCNTTGDGKVVWAQLATR
jgi:anti-sigma regulatory factor (Ser/Thr protein kinase)